jgi:hypothetical protein
LQASIRRLASRLNANPASPAKPGHFVTPGALAPVTQKRALMHMPEHLEVREGFCHFSPRGESSLVEAVTLISGAIAYCRAHRKDKLLVNVTGLAGVAIPSLVDRFLMVEEWAIAGKGMVVAAMVVHAEYIHPEKFGVRVAADLGLMVDVFTSEEDALQWLMTAPHPSGPSARD